MTDGRENPQAGVTAFPENPHVHLERTLIGAVEALAVALELPSFTVTRADAGTLIRWRASAGLLVGDPELTVEGALRGLLRALVAEGERQSCDLQEQATLIREAMMSARRAALEPTRG